MAAQRWKDKACQELEGKPVEGVGEEEYGSWPYPYSDQLENTPDHVEGICTPSCLSHRVEVRRKRLVSSFE